MTDPDRADVATRAARAGGRSARESFRTALTVETKANKNDLVTAADRAAQAAVAERIGATYPGETVVAEEDDALKRLPDTGPAWVVDPIDGTANYVRGLGVWTTSVAAVVDGEAVGAATVLPAMDDEFAAGAAECRLNGEGVTVSGRADPETFAVAVLGWGPGTDRSAYRALATTVIERFGDMRRLGSMQAALAFVAGGQLDAAITTRAPEPWDSIAGAHLVERAGGAVTGIDGGAWRHGTGAMVVSNGRAHSAVLEAARDSRAEIGGTGDHD